MESTLSSSLFIGSVDESARVNRKDIDSQIAARIANRVAGSHHSDSTLFISGRFPLVFFLTIRLAPARKSVKAAVRNIAVFGAYGTIVPGLIEIAIIAKGMPEAIAMIPAETRTHVLNEQTP